ncbi:ThiF family adenylyltransferase [Streptomyces sp. NPDC015220]|uniref:ThiF family adenylyltransferase n=1 Tax=Streptomyces sp. NPDC015220 TaxID=3364947 RepID=UPI0036F68A6C
MREKFIGTYDDDVYWQRVDRSQAWLGETDEEQHAAQLKLRGATVGIAGCGGIGGAVAVRLARLGVLNLKVADPDAFDWTNINRQLGATRHTVGRNKAQVVAELAHDLAGDVTVEVFEEGITPENAEEFVAGCDVVLDQMDFYLIRARYALHRAFRKDPRPLCVLSAWCVGWGTSVYKYTHDSEPIEERYGLPEDAELTPEVIKELMEKFVPKAWRFPSVEVIEDWLINKRKVPLFAGTPPIAEAHAVQRTALVLTGLEREPYATVLPPSPMSFFYDGSTLEAELIDTSTGKRVDT